MKRFTTAPRTIILIIALVVLLRLGFVGVFGHTLSLQASGYDVYARHLVAGQGYTGFDDLHPDSDLPPLYPYFLAGVYTVAGRSAITVALVQIVLDAVTIATIYAIGQRIAGRTVGLLAAAFTGFYPYLLFQNLTVNDTAIFITLVTLSVFCLYRVLDTRSWRWAIAAGLLLGLAALTKSLVLLMISMIALWWWRRLDFRVALRLGGLLAATTLIVLLPWIVRNTRLQGSLTLISTNDGSNLYQGNNPCIADYLWAGWDAQWADCLVPVPSGLTESQESAWFRDQAITYLRNHITAWPSLLTAKFIALWSPDIMPRAIPPSAQLNDSAVLEYEQPVFKAARIIHLLYFTPLLILGLIGWWRARRDNLPIAPLIMLLVTVTVAYLIFHPSTRYRSPADPFLFVLSAYGVVCLWRQAITRFVRRQDDQPAA